MVFTACLLFMQLCIQTIDKRRQGYIAVHIDGWQRSENWRTTLVRNNKKRLQCVRFETSRHKAAP
jgi:hypothetical protein